MKRHVNLKSLFLFLLSVVIPKIGLEFLKLVYRAVKERDAELLRDVLARIMHFAEAYRQCGAILDRAFTEAVLSLMNVVDMRVCFVFWCGNSDSSLRVAGDIAVKLREDDKSDWLVIAGSRVVEHLDLSPVAELLKNAMFSYSTVTISHVHEHFFRMSKDEDEGLHGVKHEVCIGPVLLGSGKLAHVRVYVSAPDMLDFEMTLHTANTWGYRIQKYSETLLESELPDVPTVDSFDYLLRLAALMAMTFSSIKIELDVRSRTWAVLSVQWDDNTWLAIAKAPLPLSAREKPETFFKQKASDMLSYLKTVKHTCRADVEIELNVCPGLLHIEVREPEFKPAYTEIYRL